MRVFFSIIAGLVGVVLLGYSEAGSALGNRPLIVPPDLVTTIEITEPATVNAEGDIELTIGVAVENQGRSDAGIFKIAMENTIPKGAFVAPFTVTGQSNNWYPYTSDPLVPRGVVKFKGNVILPSSLRGETISLNAIADSCSGDEFMKDYCRVKESNEENNKSNT